MASGEPGVGVAAPLAAAPVLLDEVFLVAVEEAMAMSVSPKRRTSRARDGSGRKRGDTDCSIGGPSTISGQSVGGDPAKDTRFAGPSRSQANQRPWHFLLSPTKRGIVPEHWRVACQTGTTNVVSSIWEVLIFSRNQHAAHGIIGNGGIGKWAPTNLFRPNSKASTSRTKPVHPRASITCLDQTWLPFFRHDFLAFEVDICQCSSRCPIQLLAAN